MIYVDVKLLSAKHVSLVLSFPVPLTGKVALGMDDETWGQGGTFSGLVPVGVVSSSGDLKHHDRTAF